MTGGELRFDGRVAVVTGAGRGMGAAHARLLASRGASVIVNDLPADDDPAGSVAAEIVAAGGKAVASTDDIASEDGARALAARALDAFGGLHVVVNNAGVMRLSRFEDLTPEAFDLTMRVNAFGPYCTTRAAWPTFLEQGYGRVVMISSSAALYGLPDRADYGASKAAVIGLTRSLAAEADDHDIRVNAVFPTAITRMSTPQARRRVADRLGMSAADEDVDALMARSTALVSPMVAWLSHEECTSNGEVYEAGGGHLGRVVIASTTGHDAPELSVEDVRDNEARICDATSLDWRPAYRNRASGFSGSAPR